MLQVYGYLKAAGANELGVELVDVLSLRCVSTFIYCFLIPSCLVMLLICTANAGLELSCNIRILS